ncbi:Crp/Fnr family transcriptional regulator [Candidatus Electronema sp. TJ]|uniref:Crp/Fnr family transcriptional regulator n=1 Tax=Candidatus Electronema sp. TJ TaxID=3401573 RepID=UPI003AA7C8D0
MDFIQLLGFLAAFLMFSTFYMKNMIPLRIVGIASNITFIVYTFNAHVWPIFVLHTALLPMNCLRLAQMIRLIKQVRRASEGDMSFEFMIPHMTKELLKEGDVVFRKGDAADKIYLLKSGALRVDELDVAIRPGELFGEMGVFASEQVRSATLRCKTDVELLSMTAAQIRQLYYQNPDFGFYLIQLLLKRFSQNEVNGLKAVMEPACAAAEAS